MKAKDRFSSNAPATDQMSADSTASSGNSFELGSQRQQQNGAAAGWERSGSSLSVLRIGIGQIGSREECQRKLGEQRGTSTVDRWLASFFRLLGHWIADCRVPLALGLLLFSALASSSIPFTPQQDDLRSGYTPKGAPSRTELARYERFFRPAEERRKKREVLDLESQRRHLHQKDESAGSEEPISLLVFVQARDNGSLLEEKRLEEAVQLMDRLANDFPLGGRSFAQFCSDFCQLNEPVRQFTNGFLIRQRHLLIPADAEEGGARVNLSFPFMSLLGRSIDLSPHFFGTQLGQDGQLASLRLILLHFKADWPPGVGKPEVIAWERRIVHFLHSQYQGQLRPLAFTMGFVADEVVRTGMTLFPFLSVGFATMCAFSIGTVLVSAFYFRQFSRHKIVMALVACCCPLLACSSALGLLFWLGFRFGTILCVSPFLVLAIGVDDAFLMLQSWQRICGENGQRMTIFRPTTKSQWPGTQNNGKSLLRQRIGQMLVDVGPSITITSATNVLAFCVGIFTPTPEIQLFCAGNAVAIFFDYLYQLFLFTPCLAIVGQWEMETNEKIKQKERSQKDKGKKRMMLEMFGDRFRAELRQGLGTFMLAYCRWIASGFTASMVFGLLVAYWLVAANYARKVVPNITPAKLFLADSVLNEVIGLKDAYIVPNYMPVSVFVEKAGPLGEPTQMDRVKSLVEEFEREPNNRGPAFTHFWLRDYEQYLGTELAEEEQQQLEEASADGKNGTSADGSEKKEAGTFGRARMAGFLGWPEYRHWNGFLRFGSDGQLDRFFFITAFHGPELVEWNSRARLLGRWRAIAEKYADLGAFVWVEEAQFLDQIETLVPATIQSSIATLLCMSLVCSLFMSNLFTVVVATLSIVSICLGAFGLLVAWGIDLDPISMATTIMSIGFSVDFPAHITYHYYRCGKGTTTGRPLALSPEQRVRTALLAIGFPLLQCGLSTILFVLCLLFVDTYMSEVFVKTMTLVVSLGLLHGLFVVPTMLCALSNLNNWLEAVKSRFFPSKSAKGQRKNSFSSRKLQRTGSSKLVVSVAGPA